MHGNLFRLAQIAAAAALVGATAAAGAPAGDGHRIGRTVLAPTFPSATRAGALQHAPSNLAPLRGRRPQPRGLSTRRAVPPAPTITSAPTGSTTDRNASFVFIDTDATARFQCGRDGSGFSACTSPRTYTGLAYGSHTFRVRALNASGTSAAASYTWKIVPPSAPPAPTITSGPTSPTTARSAIFAFVDADPGATFQCSLDGAAFAACASPATYAGPLPTATHVFLVRARNTGGTSPATRLAWTIVAGPSPTPTITAAPPATTTDRSATFAFIGTDTTATFQCSLDGAPYAACTSPTLYSGPLALGPHTFAVQAVGAGGTSSAATAAWTIVSPGPPPAPTVTAQPPSTTTDTTATFSFAVADASATFRCSLDGAPYAACTSPQTYTGLASTTHTFAVTATNAGGTGPAATVTWNVTAQTLRMRLLVVSADGKETDLPAITSYLGQLGVPYTVLVATETPLTPSLLWNGYVGNYQGVILTTGNLTYSPDGGTTWTSAFTAEEWQALWAYEAQFRVRQVTSYTFPYGLPDDYGLDLVTYQDTLQTPLQAALTDAGKTVFPYLNASTPITFAGAWAYLATKRDATVTPLIQTSAGYVLASVDSYADGRENLAVTVANNAFLRHSQLLSYGLVNWVTRGVFLGQRKVTMDVQVDDLLIDSNMWDPVAHTDHDADPQNGTQYRLDGADWQNIVDWQSAVRARSPQLAGFTLEWAFNGEGAFGDPPTCEPLYANDTLTPAVKANPGVFNYLNHTYDHENVDLTSYAISAQQIQWNVQAGSTGLGGSCPPGLGLGPTFDQQGFVQPDISGLTNASFLQAAYDNGIRYLIADTSLPAWSNPSPNTGFTLGPNGGILAIPRHPTNLFYSLRTPVEWVDAYNWFYWKGSESTSPWKFWDSPQTIAQIVDHESDALLSYLLRWDIDPLMFHQANLGIYGGERFLLADLLDATFAKYLAVYTLPIVNLTEGDVGRMMAARAAYDASAVEGTLVACQTLTLTVQHAAAIPVTGVSAGTTESYGGQQIATVQVSPGTPTRIPVQC